MKSRNIATEALKSVCRATLAYKIARTAVCFYYYIKSYLYVRDTFYSEQFGYVLNKYLRVNFKRDWIGRLYGVVNPAIDINGNIDFSTQIIEFNDNGFSTDNYVKNWVYKQFSLIKNIFNLQSSGFFDHIGAEFKHVGPENGDNWLVVLDIVERANFARALRRAIKQIIIYGVIITCVYFAYNIIY